MKLHLDPTPLLPIKRRHDLTNISLLSSPVYVFLPILTPFHLDFEETENGQPIALKYGLFLDSRNSGTPPAGAYCLEWHCNIS
jgi:hypothetical protein